VPKVLLLLHASAFGSIGPASGMGHHGSGTSTCREHVGTGLDHEQLGGFC
jgi:hypothetical protein